MAEVLFIKRKFMRIRRIIVSVSLFLAGVCMLAYGALLHSTLVLPEKGDGAEMVKSEPSLVKEASIGGLKLDGMGGIRLTYTGLPPKDCAT